MPKVRPRNLAAWLIFLRHFEIILEDVKILRELILCEVPERDRNTITNQVLQLLAHYKRAIYANNK